MGTVVFPRICAATVVVMTVIITLFRMSERTHLKSDHLPREVLGEVDVFARQIGQLVQRDPPDTESLEAWITAGRVRFG